MESKEYTGTIISSTINLSNTILGSGVLAMAYAFSSFGLIPSILLTLLSGFTSMLGLYLLYICATYVEDRKSSFNKIALLTYPKASVFIDLAIGIKCFGVSISYLIIISQLMPQVCAYFITTEQLGLKNIVLNPGFWSTISILTLIPICFMKHLDSLKFTSGIALMSVLYLIIVTVYYSRYPYEPQLPDSGFKWVGLRNGWSSLANFPLFVFGFTCHQNIFTIYNELNTNSKLNMKLIIFTSISTGILTYEIIGILGYVKYGLEVKDNILSMFDTNMIITIGRFGVVLLCLFSYPLQCHPCRLSTIKVIKYLYPDDYQTITNHSNESSIESIDIHSPDIPVVGEVGVSITRFDQLLFIAATSAILLFSYLLALFLTDDLGIVLSFVGSTGSTAISFILPGLFYSKMDEHNMVPKSKLQAYGANFLTGYGLLIMIVCFFFNIRKLL